MKSWQKVLCLILIIVLLAVSIVGAVVWNYFSWTGRYDA